MRTLVLFGALAVFGGCTAAPAPLLTIPAGHPASPETAGAPFVAPADEVSAPVAATEKAPAGEVCPVSGRPLGSMGAPVTVSYAGQKSTLCCSACVAKFEQDPKAYLPEPAPAPEPHRHGEGR